MINMIRKICVVTGTRAEYGLLRPIIQAIKEHPYTELLLIVSGIHLLYEFGHTFKEIEKDGFKIDAKVEMTSTEDSSSSMAISVGKGIIGMIEVLNELKPDIIVVLGDRSEPFAATVAAAFMNIPIAHIHGGDKCMGACIDDSIRHAITKFAHIHFPATDESNQRIINMGEEHWRTHVVGAPGLDSILNKKLIKSENLVDKFNIDLNQSILIVIQHPVTTEFNEASSQIRKTLEAIVELKHQTLLIYPNSDIGGRTMINVIKEYEKYSFIKTFKNIPHKEYLSLMNVANVFIGNSSSGIIEAPSFGLPVVNIGSRQEGRQRADNVIDVNYNKEEIKAAIKKALYDENFKKKAKNCKNPYGDGNAAIKIVDSILSE